MLPDQGLPCVARKHREALYQPGVVISALLQGWQLPHLTDEEALPLMTDGEAWRWEDASDGSGLLFRTLCVRMCFSWFLHGVALAFASVTNPRELLCTSPVAIYISLHPELLNESAASFCRLFRNAGGRQWRGTAQRGAHALFEMDGQ